MVSYSGLWDKEYGQSYSMLSTSVNINSNYDVLARAFANKIYSRGATGRLLRTLVGAAAGTTATLSHKRAKAERDLLTNANGGKRVIETFYDINRATTAADATRLQSALDLQSRPATYPKDKAGVGGGGKLGW